MKIEKILLATDLSPAARQAYELAVELARRCQARLLLTHVNELGSFGFHTSDEVIAYMNAVAERLAMALTDEARSLTDLGVDTRLLELSGTPHVELVDAAEKHHADLIVLTRRGGGPPRHLHYGSTAKRVVRHATVPVLIAPGDQTEPQTMPGGIRRILATTDFSEDSRRGLRLVLELAARLQAHVTVAHVLRLPNPLPAIPGEPPLYFPRESIDDLQAFHERELAELVRSFGAENVDWMVTINADSADGVLELGREMQADLIALPTHGKGALRAVLLGSTSERVVKLADRPVLLLPRPYLSKVADAEVAEG